MSFLMGKGVNSSDKIALKKAIAELLESQTSITDLRQQFCQKINNEGLRDPMFLKARTTIERLATTIPRRIDALKEKEQVHHSQLFVYIFESALFILAAFEQYFGQARGCACSKRRPFTSCQGGS